MGFPNIWNLIPRPNLTHLATYICVYMCVCVCRCVCVCAHMCVSVYIYTYTHAHMYGCTHIHTHVCIHVCAYIQLIVSHKLCTRYLHQALEGTNHSGVTRMRELLSNYWWEFKNRDIKSHVDSCDTCAKCKGNYGKRTRWPIGHCKRGRKPFDLVFIDFATMSNS